MFRSLRAHQYSSNQKKILKGQSAQTTARVVSVAYRLWLPVLINRVLNLTKLRSVICDIYIYIYIYMYIIKSNIENGKNITTYLLLSVSFHAHELIR